MTFLEACFLCTCMTTHSLYPLLKKSLFVLLIQLLKRWVLKGLKVFRLGSSNFITFTTLFITKLLLLLNFCVFKLKLIKEILFHGTPLIFCIIFVMNQTSQLVNRLQVVNLFFFFFSFFFFGGGRDVVVLGKPFIYGQSQWYTSLLLTINFKQIRII